MHTLCEVLCQILNIETGTLQVTSLMFSSSLLFSSPSTYTSWHAHTHTPFVLRKCARENPKNIKCHSPGFGEERSLLGKLIF